MLMSKPVAYGMLTFCKNCGEQNPYSVREITDEEIWKLADMVLENSDVIGFARAILRKAQEK
jgi:hypothetical protein